MKLHQATSALLLVIVLSACSHSRFVTSNGIQDSGITIGEARTHCLSIVGAYKEGIKLVERSDVLTKSGLILSGIGGLYEGVTGGSSRAVINYATAGTLLYAGQEFIIRRPTRVDIYNTGIKQVHCILDHSPATDSPAWLTHFNTTFETNYGDVVGLALNFVYETNSLLDQIDAASCESGLDSSVNALGEKKSQVLAYQTYIQKAGEKLYRSCEAVATEVSNAINKDTPTVSDINSFLSGVTLDRGRTAIDAESPEDGDGTSQALDRNAEQCAELVKKSRALVSEMQTFLDFAVLDTPSGNHTCINAIVPQVLRLAGHSPYAVKKDGATIGIFVLGGKDPVTIQSQQASANAPTAAFVSDARRIDVTPKSETGAFVFSVIDNAGAELSFVVVVE